MSCFGRWMKNEALSTFYWGLSPSILNNCDGDMASSLGGSTSQAVNGAYNYVWHIAAKGSIRQDSVPHASMNESAKKAHPYQPNADVKFHSDG